MPQVGRQCLTPMVSFFLVPYGAMRPCGQWHELEGYSRQQVTLYNSLRSEAKGALAAAHAGGGGW